MESLKIIQLICNSLLNKIDELRIFTYDQNSDILCLNETWLKGKEPKITDYTSIWRHRHKGDSCSWWSRHVY